MTRVKIFEGGISFARIEREFNAWAASEPVEILSVIPAMAACPVEGGTDGYAVMTLTVLYTAKEAGR